MLTKEQRTALKIAEYELKRLSDKRYSDYDSNRTKRVIQSMLNQSSPAWEITEERQAALKVAIGDLDPSENIGYLSELRAMLGEAR